MRFRLKSIHGVLLCTILGAGGCSDEQEEPANPECPAYSGIAGEGTTWEWEPSPSYASEGWSGTGSRTITNMREEHDHLIVELETVSDLVRGGTEYHTEGSWRYRCDERGMLMLSFENRTDPTGPGTGTTTYEEQYDPPMLVVPAGLQGGDTWTSDMTLTVATTTDLPAGEEVEWSHTATADQQDTPAGSFDVISVRTETGTGPRTERWAAAEGLVATDNTVLTRYIAR